MKMKVLLDMNLSPRWVGFLQQEGFEAAHWSTIGDIRASDAMIMSWAHQNGFIVFTHDLDFSALLAATQATGPSVVQLRTQDLLPEAIGRDVVRVLRLRATAAPHLPRRQQRADRLVVVERRAVP